MNQREAGHVITVAGAVPAAEVGFALTHEHVLNNTMTWFRGSAGADMPTGAFDPVTIENAAWLRQYPYHNRDNLLHADLGVLATELRRYKLAGGVTMVDASSEGLGRDVWALKRLSDEVGLNIVAGSGYYVDPTHPWDMDERSVEALADEMIRDITTGVGSSGIRCGLIGEIGTSDPVTDNEWKVVRAAAMAQLATGAAIEIHALHETRSAPAILDVVPREGGVHPTRVIQCHMDLVLDDWDYTRRVADTGVFVEYDCFGHLCPTEGVWVSDDERVAGVMRLIEAGYEKQLLLSQDIGLTARLAKYGGPGWAHLIHVIVPKLLDRGCSRSTLTQLFVTNPARAFGLAVTADA